MPLKGEWSKMTSYERSRLIWKFADELEKNLDLATELEVLDNGMPRMAAYYSIAKFGCDFLRYYAGWPTKLHGDTIPVSPAEARNGDSLTYTRREPIGVVGATIPWKPLVMASSSRTRARGRLHPGAEAGRDDTADRLLADIVSVGFPTVVNIVRSRRTAGAALAAPDVDKIASPAPPRSAARSSTRPRAT